MNDHESKPLTQNLGDVLLAAQGKPRHPRPETGIRLVEPVTDTARSEFRQAATVPAPPALLLVQNVQDTGDKSSEAEGTAAQNTNPQHSMENVMNNAQVNGTVETKSVNNETSAKAEVDQFERMVAALDRISERGVIISSRRKSDDKALAGLLIGAGVGAVVGGVGTGVAVAYLAPQPATTEEIIGAGSLGASAGILLGGGIGFVVGGREPKAKTEDKK